MNRALFSVSKSALNSWYYNGFFSTLKMLFAIALIKFKLKKSVNVSSVNGALFLRSGTSDLPAFRQIFMDQEYKIDGGNVKTIIDGGCNIGLATVYFASKYPGAKIISIEPDTENYRQAILNTKTLKQVTVLKAGLWGKSCYLKAQPGAQYGEWGVSLVESFETHKDNIKGITIDSIMKENNWDTVDLLKLDIEGSEIEVFNSNYKEWIYKVKTIVIELHDWMRPGCAIAFFSALTNAGVNYSYSRKGENVIVVIND